MSRSLWSPIFNFRPSRDIRGSESGLEAFSQPLFVLQPPRLTEADELTLQITLLIQVFDFINTWDEIWSGSWPEAFYQPPITRNSPKFGEAYNLVLRLTLLIQFFDFRLSWNTKRSGSGQEAFSQPLISRNPQKFTEAYVLVLRISEIFQFFDFLLRDARWSVSESVLCLSFLLTVQKRYKTTRKKTVLMYKSFLCLNIALLQKMPRKRYRIQGFWQGGVRELLPPRENSEAKPRSF